MEQNFDPKVVNIIKALSYTENGGKPNVSNLKAGGSGELKSMLQFEPTTWKEYSKQVTGKDNLPVTPENESVVAYGKVSDWLKNGYTPEQIASVWNSGRPQAYQQGNKGINKSGVNFDTPNYVKKFSSYLNEFEGTKNSPGGSQKGIIETKTIPDIPTKPPFKLERSKGLMNSKIKKPSL